MRSPAPRSPAELRRPRAAQGRAAQGRRRGLRAALAARHDAALAACRGDSRDRGSSAVELAILGIVVIFAGMLIIEYGLWFDARHAALAAAQQGDLIARETAFANQQGWAGLAETAAESYYRGLDTSVLSGVTAKAKPGLLPNTVSVQVTGSLNGVISLPINVTVTGPIECFRTQASHGTAC